MGDLDLDTYDPMERSVQQNPYPFYAELRRRAPVFRHPRTGMFFVSTLDRVNEVLAAPEIYSSQLANTATLPAGGVRAELLGILSKGFPPVNTMLTADPPLQTRYRKTVGRAFSSRRILALEPRIRELCADLVSRWPERGIVPFHDEFAVSFPVRVISFALGMKPEVEPRIKPWSDDSVAALGVEIDDARRLEAARGLVEMQHYWASEFADRRTRPRDDFLTDLARAQFEDETGAERLLAIPELLSIIQQLMVAGNETTTKLLNETIRLLIENPEEWRRIQRDPSRIPAMIEESLRLSTPNQGMFRVALRDAELGGVRVPKGSMLWIMFGSANRDERVFPDPDRFDPTRENLRDHIAFGRGAHFCIGAPLARLETRIAFEEIVKRVDRIAFAPGQTFEYEPSYILRGLKTLSIEVRKKPS